MKRYSWFALVFVFFIFYCLNCNVWAAKELYDDFSGTYIDSQRWKSCEFVREIVAGKLVSKIGNDSGTGVYRNNTAFQNPESINVIKCEITVEDTILDTGNDPLSVARIGGYFYNTKETGGATGDIYAGVVIGDRGNGGLEAYWVVLESKNDDLDNLVEKGSGTLMAPGTVNRGTPYTMTISYDGDNGFEFTAGTESDSYSGPARKRAAISQFKGLGTTVGNEDGGSGIGYASAWFDNVYINDEATAYDTFDTAPLDNDNWKTLETVREISDGKLRINAHADWSTQTQGIGLIDYNTSYLEAKVTVKSDSWLSPGALAFTRIDGYFYNDSHGPGSGQDYNGYEGNIHAQVRIMLHDDLSMVATAAVFRSDDPDSSSATQLFSKDFTIPISFDTPYTLSIYFTGSEFLFRCNDETLGYSVATPIYMPYNEARYLVSRVYAGGAGESGYMKTDFDDVYCILVQAEMIGTWSNGIWYRDVAESKWTKMWSNVPSGDIAAGDFTGDGKADVASIWSSGLWYQNGATLGWTKVLSTAPSQLTAGDVTGDGRSEIIGTWSSGIWYRNVATSSWTKMYSGLPSGQIAAGDFTGDGKADVASCWSSGLYYQNGATLGWTRVSTLEPDHITAGDMTGDRQDEIIIAWREIGLWSWDVAKAYWRKLYNHSPPGEIAAGDFTGDGIADVAACWGSGLWFQNGATLGWTKVLSTAPTQLTAGDVTGD